MIRANSITISKFRGIRNLSIDLGGENFAIYGPNGTGKSGVVDAIEFVLTGTIGRLTGRGTLGISVREHGPHVDFKSEPRAAIVTLKGSIPRLGKAFVAQRSVSSPHSLTITPDDPEIKSILINIASHPEFVLSRREILKYVITEAGERAKEVQALLKLDKVEKVRAGLQKITNSCKVESRTADDSVIRAKSSLLLALKIEELRPALILEAANLRREILGLTPITELDKDTSIKTDLGIDSVNKVLINKRTALVEISEIESFFNEQDPSYVRESITEVLTIINDLQSKPELLRNLKRYSFLKLGMDFLDESFCPFCDATWEIERLRQLIQSKLEMGKEAQTFQRKLEAAAKGLRNAITKLSGMVTTIVNYCRFLKPVPDPSSLQQLVENMKLYAEGLTRIDRIDETKRVLQNNWKKTSAEVQTFVKTIKEMIFALPDPSKENEAKEYLIVGQERLETYRIARRLQELWKKRFELAGIVLSKYAESSKSVLTGLYQDVEKDFSRYYAIINHEDESHFRGRLAPSLGKLGFDVDFYGRGFFPPGAYHSEGHQDGMGVCLYLALMKRTLGDEFTFAVFDDVLMSIDAIHRKEVCRLLKTEFANTQLIMTTHDAVWKEHMIFEGLVKPKGIIEFRKWSIDDGPNVWQYEEIWSEIQTDLGEGKVSDAAQGLRRFLEFSGQQLASRLRAPVPGQIGGTYDAGDLIPAVIGRWNKIVKMAKDAAQSWGQEDRFKELQALHGDFSKKVAVIESNKWMINPSIHYNEWADWGAEQFRPVVIAYRELMESFRCEACNSFVYVEPMKGPENAVRCDCNKINFNLRKKS